MDKAADAARKVREEETRAEKEKARADKEQARADRNEAAHKKIKDKWSAVTMALSTNVPEVL